MTRDTTRQRIHRTPVTVQEATEQLTRSATDARSVAVVFSSYLSAHDLPDHVAVSLALRSRALMKQAVDYLDAAVQRLEMHS